MLCVRLKIYSNTYKMRQCHGSNHHLDSFGELSKSYFFTSHFKDLNLAFLFYFKSRNMQSFIMFCHCFLAWIIYSINTKKKM